MGYYLKIRSVFSMNELDTLLININSFELELLT
ncbi:hypothetical protein GCAAIG_07335 [Candidatus Electronema halotolerans]